MATSKLKVSSKLVAKAKRTTTAAKGGNKRTGEQLAFPKHSLPRATRIALAILDQNAGKSCTREEAAQMLGLTTAAGKFGVEIASGVKFGLLE